jgi:hypothetical protein
MDFFADFWTTRISSHHFLIVISKKNLFFFSQKYPKENEKKWQEIIVKDFYELKSEFENAGSIKGSCALI